MQSTIIACQEATKDGLPNGDSVGEWITNGAKYAANMGNVVITESDSANVSILGGAKPYFTAAALTDAMGDALGVTPADTDGDGDTDDEHLGAVTAGDDWTANWTYGLDALWFE